MKSMRVVMALLMAVSGVLVTGCPTTDQDFPLQVSFSVGGTLYEGAGRTVIDSIPNLSSLVAPSDVLDGAMMEFSPVDGAQDLFLVSALATYGFYEDGVADITVNLETMAFIQGKSEEALVDEKGDPIVYGAIILVAAFEVAQSYLVAQDLEWPYFRTQDGAGFETFIPYNADEIKSANILITVENEDGDQGQFFFQLKSRIEDDNTAIVPNLIGLSETVARNTLTDVGLTTGAVARVHNSAPAGQVFSQTVAAGANLTLGSAVGFSVSLGPEVTTTTVPSLIGLTEAAARTTLINAGLVAGTVNRANNPAPAGQVFAQAVAAGTSLTLGSSVGFSVSLGPEEPDPLSVTLAKFDANSDGIVAVGENTLFVATPSDVVGPVGYGYQINGGALITGQDETFNWTFNFAGHKEVKVIATDSRGIPAIAAIEFDVVIVGAGDVQLIRPVERAIFQGGDIITLEFLALNAQVGSAVRVIWPWGLREIISLPGNGGNHHITRTIVAPNVVAKNGQKVFVSNGEKSEGPVIIQLIPDPTSLSIIDEDQNMIQVDPAD